MIDVDNINRARSLGRKALAALNGGTPKRAIRLAREATAVCPEEWKIYGIEAEALRRLGRFEETRKRAKEDPAIRAYWKDLRMKMVLPRGLFDFDF